MSTLRSPISDNILSPAWEDIIKNYNISPELAISLRNDTIEGKKIVGMRLDPREENPVQREYAMKPLYMKYKVSNWLFGKIPYDQKNLGKCISGFIAPSDKLQTPESKNPDSVPHLLRVAPLSITIQEIQHGLDIKVLKLAEDLMSQDPTILAVRPVSGAKNNPLNSNVVAAIKIQPELGIDMKQSGATYRGGELAIPNYWKKEMGDFSEAIKREFRAEYKVGNEPFHDYLVFMRPQENLSQPLLMIDKDNDGFMNSMSLKNYNNITSEAKQILNTFIAEDSEKMIEAVIKFEAYMIKQTDPSMNDFAIRKMAENNAQKYNFEAFGAGSAFDCYFVNKINSFAKSEAAKPMQHAFENMNKWKLSDLNGLVLWAGQDGQPVVTSSEDEHINYLKDHAKDLALYINPRWNLSMDKWGPIVENQIINKVMPENDTLNAFLVTSNKNGYLLNEHVLKNSVELTDSFGTEANYSRIGLLEQLTEHFNKLNRDINNSEKLGLLKNILIKLKEQIENNADKSTTPATRLLDKALLKAKNAYLNYISDAINKSIGLNDINKESHKLNIDNDLNQMIPTKPSKH